MKKTRTRLTLALILHWLLLYAFANHVQSAEPTDKTKTAVANPNVKRFRSSNIELFTDVPSKDASAILNRLEAKLRFISKYWRRSLSDKIVCYIAGDLDNWNDQDFPHSQAKLLLKHVKGAVPRTAKSRTRSIAYVYATDEKGVAEHEIVHAYCQLVFGKCGPDWYKEGMAEMASHASRRDHSFQCADDVLKVLKSNPNRTVRKLVESGKFTKPVSDVFAGFERHGRSDVWTDSNSDMIRRVRETYEQSWALCHFLCNNTNYSDRFRLLGLSYLTSNKDQFDRLFSSVEHQLDFEYSFFLKHVSNGYRVDLCRWDWKKKFSSIDNSDKKAMMIVKASHGYQPTGVTVQKGSRYNISATGRWTLDANKTECDADGLSSGRGRLEGIVLDDNFELGKPFPLGTKGTFRPKTTGRLYLRCHDAWHQLADNRQRVNVVIQKSR